MKKLITANEIREFLRSGKKKLHVDENTIVTPAAKDFAREHSVEITNEPEVMKSICEEKSPCVQTATVESKPSVNDARIDMDMIYKIVREVLAETGVVKPADDFVSYTDKSGVKLIKSQTVKLEKFEEKNPGSNVSLKDVVTTKESPNMGAGLMCVDKCKFDWTLTYDEFEYIIEGSLDVTIDGRTYTAKKGDIVFIPKNTSVTWKSDECTKFFYCTYPANWAELINNN